MSRFSHHRLFLLITLVFVAVLALAACTTPAITGPTPDNTPTATPSLHVKLGQPVDVEDTWQVALNDAMTSAKTTDATGKSIKPLQGNVFLVLMLAVVNISGDQQNAAASQQFSLKNSTGQKYRYDPVVNSDAQKKLSGPIAAAGTIDATLVYEVPKSIHTFTLTFQVDAASQTQITWDVSV